ncbi:MAG: hypothetical protein R2828_27510 [Saprospiraceae bacterium]
MKDSHLIQLLQRLRPEELTDFAIYLKNQRPRSVILRAVFDYIKKLYPDFSSEKHLDLDYMVKKLLDPGQKRKRLLNILSELHLLLKDFLVWQKVKSHSFVYDYALLEQYKDRQMDKAFFQLSGQMIQVYEQQDRQNIWSYLQLMLLYQNQFFHPKSPKLNADNMLPQQSLSLLNQFYYGAKIKLATELLSRQRILSDWDPAIEAPLIHIEVENIPLSPLILLFLKVYTLEKDQSEHTYYQLKEEFFQLVPGQHLTLDDQYFVFLHLINFTSSQIKLGKQLFLKEAFEIYKFGIQHQFLVKGQFFTPTNFSNIVNLACRLKQFQWAEYFTQTYQVYLPDGVKESATQLSLAMIYFEQGAFEKTLEQLQGLTYADAFYDLRARALRLRSFVELDEPPTLILYYCRSFEQFIRRNRQIKGDNERATFHFIQIIKTMARQKVSKTKLLAQLEKKQPLFFKTWLLEKIADYKGIV